ncbi:MAG TPA: redoxin domain-containing protein, partial [Pirellulales bacterium]|nr:redoxin domain-containing protein [Pirellulales bacterium]
ERFRIVSQPHPLLGQTAPDFTLADHLDRPTRLTGLTARGPVFVVFYLGYSCNACIHHLVELSADVERFADLGSSIVAISADPAEQTRQRFEEYGPLPFPVLSDPAHAVAWQFEAMQAETAATADGAVGQPERPLHAALLIDRAGVVRWAYRGETPFRDTQAIFAELADLERCSPRPSPETIGP